MDTGKEIGGTAAITAVRLIAAPEAIGLLTPKGELSAADGMRPSPLRTPASTAADLPVVPTVAELSSGAQLLLKLLGDDGQPAAKLASTPPLLAAPPTLTANGPAGTGDLHRADSANNISSGTQVIAQALQGALETSGLFYESHLADWVGGQRSLEAIRTEPQALLHDARSVSQASAAASDDTVMVNAPALNAIVNAQLDVLDSGQLRWQGELWPGMLAEIWMKQDTPDRDTADAGQRNGDSANEQSGRRWQARLVTTLPVLGKISTQFTLQGDKLDVKLSSTQAATAAALDVASPQLAGSLQASGLLLQAFVSHIADAANDPASKEDDHADHTG